jgi:hypothetical protein
MTRLRLYTIDRDARQVVAIDRSPVFPLPDKRGPAISVLAANERDALTKADNVPARF